MPDMPSSTFPLAPRRERVMLLTLAAIQFINVVDFMLMMPLGPQLTVIFGISDAQFGLLISAYTLAAGASGLAATTYIDRFERRRLLLILFAGLAAATLACGLAPTFHTLMAARVAAGLFGGVVGSLVQTIVADAVPFERRGTAMGMVMAAFSMATVAGVPASLWLANAQGWHAPFLALPAVSVLIWLAASRLVPRMTGHLTARSAGESTAQQLRQVLGVRNHWRAFALTVLMVFSSFTMIPYITLFTTTNLGLTPAQVPMIYLVGGLATLISSQLLGRLADRWGKVQTLRLVALLALAPMLALPQLAHWGLTALAQVLVVTTLFFVLVSGRMVPGMALVTSAVEPRSRGAFMSLNNAMQSGAMGVASLVGGLLIWRDGQGQVQGYARGGWLALVCTLGVVWLVGRLQVVATSRTT
jgi:predicted MFS family arabinose efflux permease